MRNLSILLMVCLFAFPAHGDQGRSVSYQIDGKPYEGYFVSLPKDSPLVFIVHDWDGLTGYEKKRARMLADLGFSVFAVDLFGAGVRPVEVADKRRLTTDLYQNREKMRARMNGAFSAAQSLGANTANAVAAGYCFGGAAVLEWARSGKNLKGFVSFHGGLETPEGQDYQNTKGRILVLHGSADASVTMDQFAGLAKELEANGISHEMTTYSAAPHAFTVFGSDRYRETADKASWARFVSFLGEVLK